MIPRALFVAGVRLPETSHSGRSRCFGSLSIQNSRPSASSSTHHVYAPPIFHHHSLYLTPLHSVLPLRSLTSSHLLPGMQREYTTLFSHPCCLPTPEAVVRTSKQLLSLRIPETSFHCMSIQAVLVWSISLLHLRRAAYP
jgi:hypothetical protein